MEGAEASLRWAKKRVRGKILEVANGDELSKKQREVLLLGLGGLREES